MIRSLVAPANPAVVPVPHEDGLGLRRNLASDSLAEAMRSSEHLAWVDIVDADDNDIRWLESTLNLHPAVVSDLRRDDRRPTLLIYPEYIFISLFQARFEKAAVVSDEIHILIAETSFVTVRKASSSAIDGAYERAAQNESYWQRGVPNFLYLTMQFIVDSYYPLVDRISNQLNKLEEQAMTNGSKELQRSVFRLKQQLINLRQMVAPQREVISNVIGEERLSRTGEMRELFRHLYERLLRIYDVIDAQRDLAGNVLDLIQSQESSNLANAVSRLTVLSMVFLPITFIVGLFGLNFVTTSPELEIPLAGGWVFAGIIVLALGIAAAIYWLFHKRGWL
jgi:magnesium transporter